MPSHHLENTVYEILNCANDIGTMKRNIDELYSIFCQYTPVNVQNQNDAEIILPSGKAISPGAAAHCLLEITRTTKFLRGIKKAIDQKLKDYPGRKIYILYAGCGPYAALITPLLTLFSNDELAVDFLDINETSLFSARDVINGLELNQFIGEYLLEDASTYQVKKDYDIVISETLQAALRNEPFVAIYQNLVPQMKKECVFIPEEVTVDIAMETIGKWNAEKGRIEQQERRSPTRVITINKNTVLSKLHSFELVVENDFDRQLAELKFFTIVRVYAGHVLGKNECSLNIPYKIDELGAGERKHYQLSYDQSYPAQINIKMKPLINDSILTF